ncbi:hypothetical protein [Hydrogenovibrio sp. JE_KL2]|uniref:hypothetical protein n=1 Tax=Hydrogenovibrio sp. JE_KL2 TaxID=2651188 RepID=UPI00128D71BB|nr:hypothetical protein [Hydrogenovibrio sp. JE_KL2]MPQ75882.1 hypothetical protein [Hydrogenovibrio sp. JE_KL2]
MKLSGPKRDLKIAALEINKMKQTESFDEFQESWENFLFRIERSWELTERNLKSNEGFTQWYKPYTILRKKDPLLVFLKQARNSEMHCISSTVTKPLKMVIKDKTGNGITVNSISSKLESGTLTINIDSPDIFPNVSLDVIPTSPQLTRFKNRGKWYNPPWHHLKVKIMDLHPVSIAEMGLTFYKAYISDAEIFLEQNNSNKTN